MNYWFAIRTFSSSLFRCSYRIISKAKRMLRNSTYSTYCYKMMSNPTKCHRMIGPIGNRFELHFLFRFGLRLTSSWFNSVKLSLRSSQRVTLKSSLHKKQHLQVSFSLDVSDAQINLQLKHFLKFRTHLLDASTMHLQITSKVSLY